MTSCSWCSTLVPTRATRRFALELLVRLLQALDFLVELLDLRFGLGLLFLGVLGCLLRSLPALAGRFGVRELLLHASEFALQLGELLRGARSCARRCRL